MRKIGFCTFIIILIISTLSLAIDKSNIVPPVAISKEAKNKLKDIKRVAVLLGGNDSLYSKIVEDALSIYLTNIGYSVISRETLEKTIGEQVAKKKKEKLDVAINALEIGTATNADALITGTVIIEPIADKTVSTKAASFQLIDVSNEKALISIVLEFETGQSITETARNFSDLLKKYLEE